MLFTALVALVCGLVSWRLQASAREAERQRLRATRHAFREVGGSLRLYDTLFGHVPYPVRRESPGRPTQLGMTNGSGRPLYSWRAELAQLAQRREHVAWDSSQPWDNSANQVMASVPSRYCYEGMRRFGAMPTAGPATHTNMLAITGPGTAFGDDNEQPRSLKELDDDTILVVEVVQSGVHWMEPGDFDVRTMPQTIGIAEGGGISSRHPAGFHVLFADGQTWFLSTATPFHDLSKFFTVADAKEHDRRHVLGPYLLDRHPSWQQAIEEGGRYAARQLSVDDPEFTDAELWQVGLRTDLHTLKLSGTQVAGEGLRWLPGLNLLVTLNLEATRVAGPGLEHLKALPKLQALLLSDAPIDDAVLERIADLAGLLTLRLDGTAITDAGLRHLERLTNLVVLDLSRTRIAGPGLVHLAGMGRLSDLHLGGTGVTDEALRHVATLKSLTSLSLHRTRVTHEAVKRLQEALPNCRIRYSGLPEDSR